MRAAIYLVSAAAASSVHAFSWVAELDGVDTKLLQRQQSGTGPGSEALCPFNPNHVPPAPITQQYPYNNAQNGLPGSGKGGYQVPAPGDTAHQYVPPGPNDIRGPCPGLNTAANHNFLPHDGIATFSELIDAQQNVYNVGYDLALVLAVIGVGNDGDIVTERLSIGCDATPRTSVLPLLTGSEPGLDGHDKFESDASLTRNDYFSHKGNNFRFNQTLFDMMTETTKRNYNLPGLSLYRHQRFQQSVAENPNFFFGPSALVLLYGAATFLYELFPNGNHDYAPDFETISSFFVHEKIPDNWTNRVTPYGLVPLVEQVLAMYLMHPVLVGGNTGQGEFDVIDYGDSIKNGQLVSPSVSSILCLVYQIATARVPSTLNGVLTPTLEAVMFATGKLNPIFKNLGCPLVLT